MALTIEQALQQGVAAHNAGNLKEAERIYRAVLQTQPEHPSANHNLGLIAISANQIEAALSLFKTALNVNSNVEQFWISYIDALVRAQRPIDAKQAIKKAKKKGLDTKKLNTLLSQSKREPDNKMPSDAQLISLLELYQRGRFDDAEKLSISITQKFPKHQFAWKVLGLVCKQTGRLIESLTAMKKSVQLEPQDAEAHSNLGNTLKELGRLDEAVISYKQAIALKPEYAEAHSNLGVTLQKLGRLDKAEASYKQAIALRPDFAEAHYNLGVTLQGLGKLDEAETCFTRAIGLKPDYAQAHGNLGNTLHELGKLDDAEASHKQAIALKADYAEAHNNLGNTLHELGRLDEAQASYVRALTLKPDYAHAHQNLGVTLQELGRLDDAEASYKQAITLKPDYAQAHRHLAALKKFDTCDEQYSEMLNQYADANISEEQRCHINFGLAKACEDLQDFEKAFEHYSEGNMLRKKLLKYDISQDIELFKKIKSSYPNIVQHSLEPNKSSPGLTPVFILGMPRSGTTLVEQIASSHSQVTGAGELYFATQFGASIAEGLTESNTDTLLTFKEKYLIKLQSVSGNNLIVTDKMPHNFLYIGLLAAAFPEAKIIHVRRNSAAVCWANYKQYFSNQGFGYSYDLVDTVSYYKLYADLMEFWDVKLPNRIYNLDYETLTTNPDEETRKLIRHLDLDWENKCLSPQDNKRSVVTASNIQVRQKIYQGSSEQWRKYELFLNGAFDDLRFS